MTTIEKTVSPDIMQSSLPLFYKTPVVLNATQHGKSGLADGNGFSFAREAVAVPLDLSELIPAARTYPIVFSNTEQPVPLAVLGIKQDRNLFLDDDGTWLPNCYIPAYVRRYPFIITELLDEDKQLLAIDTTSERFIPTVSAKQEKYRLFDNDGGPTELARAAIAFCSAFHEEHLQTVGFCQALRKAGLLTANHVNMQLPDGSRYTLDGFQVVDEKVFRELPDETLGEWNKKGWLDLIVLHFFARQNWQTLLDLNALRNKAA